MDGRMDQGGRKRSKEWGRGRGVKGERMMARWGNKERWVVIVSHSGEGKWEQSRKKEGLRVGVRVI